MPLPSAISHHRTTHLARSVKPFLLRGGPGNGLCAGSKLAAIHVSAPAPALARQRRHRTALAQQHCLAGGCLTPLSSVEREQGSRLTLH